MTYDDRTKLFDILGLVANTGIISDEEALMGLLARLHEWTAPWADRVAELDALPNETRVMQALHPDTTGWAGVPVNDVAILRALGYDPATAVAWVQAGIDLKDLILWADVAGPDLDPAEVAKWTELEIDPELALQWIHADMPFGVALRWLHTGWAQVHADIVAEWYQAFPDEDPSTLFTGYVNGRSVDDVHDWTETGLTGDGLDLALGSDTHL